MVTHCAILVNGKSVNIPSMIIHPGDTISIRPRAKNQLRIQGALALAQTRPACGWIDVDVGELSGVFKNIPDRSDLPSDIYEKLIVELYSK
jgi:small subunit ribosomal protein S4